MMKAFVAVALAGFATVASAAIANGSHDLSTRTGATLSSCQYCHAPHNVNPSSGGAPLWNRNLAAGTDFTAYTSNTLNDTTVQPRANSLTCLSCHDGVSDMGDTYVGSHGFNGTNTVLAGYASVTRDLRDDHPVGVNFVAGGEFETVANVTAAGLTLYSDGAGGLTVECGSCHDPHGLSDGVSGGLSFLRAAATSICADCHLK